MTRTEMIKRIARKLDGATKDEIKVILEATEQVIIDVIENKDRVQVFNCMYVSGVEKESCLMRNPYTGGKVKVPSRISPKALFTETFRKSLRNAK